MLLPARLAHEWSNAIGVGSDFETELYDEVCGSQLLMHVISFQGSQVLRLAEEPSDIHWIPNDSGGIIVQWIGAESLDQLVEFAFAVAKRCKWQEQLEIDLDEADIRIMDASGFDGDDQPRIDTRIAPGKYVVEACHAENDNTMATIFRLTKSD